MDAICIKNDDGTFRLTDLEGNDLVLELKLLNGHAIKVPAKKDLLIWEMTDLKAYGVNIINLEETWKSQK